MKYVPCKQEEATHVMVIDERASEDYLTFGKLYEYFYDSSPSEQTYYIITDSGLHYYDFECVLKVEYWKKEDSDGYTLNAEQVKMILDLKPQKPKSDIKLDTNPDNIKKLAKAIIEKYGKKVND